MVDLAPTSCHVMQPQQRHSETRVEVGGGQQVGLLQWRRGVADAAAHRWDQVLITKGTFHLPLEGLWGTTLDPAPKSQLMQRRLVKHGNQLKAFRNIILTRERGPSLE